MDPSSLPAYHQANWQPPDDKTPYLLLTLAFTAAVFVFEFALDVRQYRRFSGDDSPTQEGTSSASVASLPQLPKELQSHVSQETFAKSVAYRRDQFAFRMCETVFSLLAGTAMVLAGYTPWLWDEAASLSAALCASLSLSVEVSASTSPSLFAESLTTWIFVALLTLVDTVTSLPFSIYSTFVVEERHGFNKSTFALFLQDKLLTLAISMGICVPILPALIWLVRAGGEHFYFYVWMFLCIVSIILMTIYPTLIAPLFNKYTKLEDGKAKQAIEDLARSVEFPLTNLFSVDGSRRSAHSNAYFYGFFKNKRIVLYDTLLKQVDLEELLAILGHEIGHWKLGHTIQGFVVTQLYTFALFLAFSYVQSTPALFTSFGFTYTNNMPVIVGLMLFTQTFWGPVDKVLNLLLTINSRKNEFAADAFAVSLGKGDALASGLIKISIENLDNMVPDPWYSSYHYSHPPLVERLKAVAALSKRKQ